MSPFTFHPISSVSWSLLHGPNLPQIMMRLAFYHVFSTILCHSLVLAFSLQSLDDAPVMHFTLARRGGAMNATLPPPHDHVDLAFLSAELQRAESRFNLTQREVAGNRLVRKAKMHVDDGSDRNEGILMGDVAAKGIWSVLLPSQSQLGDDI